MQSKLEKVVAGLKTGPRFLKELREFDNLVKAIGECKSKAEEDRIIVQELELLKQRLSDPKLDRTRGKEYMIRLIYCEMLGHDASFAYVKALQFASDPNIHTKKAAYLALTQFLDYNNQLVLLLVNTLLGDLKSDNYLIVCTALVAATKLIGPDLLNAVYPVVVERLRHPKEHVRKKAVLALHWFGQLDPRREGPLAGVELDKHFRTMLCDKDPSVMSAALCALYDSIKADSRPYKNLIPSFTSILKQVSEHRLPKSYDYHRFPAPFIQIKLLKILSVLGAGDRASSENMAAVLHQTLRRANTSHTIGSAIICECVRTITTIYPNPQLLAAAAESIAPFLRSPSHNLRYVGIDALAGITALNPAAAAEHQVAVLDCLEDPDDTLKLKTLELLYKMTKANNIQVIVDKMMGYLAACTDDHIRRDIVRKVSDLAERYAPSPSWFVTTISEVFRLGGEHVGEADAHRLAALISEQDAALHASAVEAYLGLLDAESGEAAAAAAGGVAPRKKLPETILLVICWVLGEYGHLARRPPLAVLARLTGILACHKAASERVRCTLLTALTKLAAHTGGAAGPVGAALGQQQRGGPTHGTADAGDFVHKCAASQSLELQQRAHELQALLGCSPALLGAALPVDAAREDFAPEQLAAEVAALPFLDQIVDRALAGGAAPYLPPEARGGKAADGQAKGLRFEAYEPAPYAVSLASVSTSQPATAGGATDWRSGPASAGSSSGNLYGAGAASGSGYAAGGVAAAPAEPQLMVKAAAGRKWGPAQYDTEATAGPSSAAAPAPAASSAAAAAPPRSVHHSRSGSGSATAGAGAGGSGALSGQALERERLAASLFGGGGPGGATASTTSGRAAAAAPPPAGYKQTNGAASRPAAASGAPQQPARTAVDLLMDLDLPAAPLAAAVAAPSSSGAAGPAGPPGDWMDSLMGGGPTTGGAGGTAANGPGLFQQQQQQHMGLYDILSPPSSTSSAQMQYQGLPLGGGGMAPFVSPPYSSGSGGSGLYAAPQGGPGFGHAQPHGISQPYSPQQQHQPPQAAWPMSQQQHHQYAVGGPMPGGGGISGASAVAPALRPQTHQQLQHAAAKPAGSDPFGDLLR